MSRMPVRLVDSDGALASTVERLAASDAVAIDTEFHGEKRYWPELFLVQIAGEDTGPVAIDPLGVSSLAPLAGLLESPSVVKVFHSARNDISVLTRETGGRIRSVFDTQTAAAFLGYGEQVSLSKLVRAVCGRSTHGSHSLSDWSMRPLSEEQLEYALDDVRYLLPIYRKLSGELEETGRTRWFEEEVAVLCDPATYAPSIVPVFHRTRASGRAKRRSLPVLWALVRWREEEARRQNRPRNSIAQDSQLCRIASMSPTDTGTLERLRGLPSGFAAKWGEQIAAAVSAALESPPDDVPALPERRSDSGTSARQDILRIFVKQRSDEMRISPSLLLPADSIRSLAAAPPSSLEDLMSREEIPGWRREALGEDLVALLSGRLALALDSGPGRGLRFVAMDGD